jgi:hypothetical protein
MNHDSNCRQCCRFWNDGYFSPRLEARQILTQIGAHSVLFKQQVNDILYIDQLARYGVLPQFTIGEQFYTVVLKRMPSIFDCYLNALVMNIPIREYGPGEASQFEYLFGYQPSLGQLRAEGRYRVPINRTYTYFAPQSIAEIVSMNSSALSYLYGPQPDISTRQFSTGPIASMLRQNDVDLRVSVGLSNRAALTNLLELKMMKYDSAGYYSGYSYIRSNVLYAEQLGISLSSRNHTRTTLSTAFVGQTDKNTTGSSKFEFVLTVFVQAAW